MGLPLLPYSILCVIAAFLARDTRMGFAGTLVLAFFLTPIPVFLGLFCFVRPPEILELPAGEAKAES